MSRRTLHTVQALYVACYVDDVKHGRTPTTWSQKPGGRHREQTPKRVRRVLTWPPKVKRGLYQPIAVLGAVLTLSGCHIDPPSDDWPEPAVQVSGESPQSWIVPTEVP